MTKAWSDRGGTGALWAAVYALLAAAPLGLALLGPLPEKRPLLVELGVALGFVALSMMGLNFVLTARAGGLSRRLGQDTLLQFHRQTGLLAGALVLLHPAVIIVGDPAYAAFFDPRENLARAAALSLAVVAVAALLLTAMLRARIGLRYEWWRLCHGALGALLLLIGMAHITQVNHYLAPWWKKGLFVALALAPLLLLVFVRVVRPWLLRRRAWEVVEVRREGVRTWTIALEARGERGLDFQPGQFAWLTIADSPYDLQQHPFTMASSAESSRRVEFTIKELGDYTNTIGQTPVGATAYLEGPAGNFTPPDDAPRIVLIAGGIGVTPAMSVLRTMRDRADTRPATLVYATETLEKGVFAEELENMRTQLDLRVVRVLEKAPQDWGGETGFIDAATLRRRLDEEDIARAVFLVCGPDPMMDAVEGALHEIGVAARRVQSERFSLV